MRLCRKWAKALLLVSCAAAASDGPPHPDVRPVLSEALPKLDAGRLQVSLVEVAYRPGGYSASHRHPCPVVAYVVQGAIRSQLQGQAERTYRAGEAFYEAPNGNHLVSANASEGEPAKLLAFFVCDGARPLSVADGAQEGKTP